MHISLSLLFLLVGSTSTLKQGDFGLFTACLVNNRSLRLHCHYALCPNSPPYDCNITTSDGIPLPNQSKNCSVPLLLPEHRVLYANNITRYNCTLKRKDRKEVKQITINYSKRTGRDHIKACKGSTGLLLHRASAFLWPVVSLSLWRVLGTDSQAT